MRQKRMEFKSKSKEFLISLMDGNRNHLEQWKLFNFYKKPGVLIYKGWDPIERIYAILFILVV